MVVKEVALRPFGPWMNRLGGNSLSKRMASIHPDESARCTSDGLLLANRCYSH